MRAVPDGRDEAELLELEVDVIHGLTARDGQGPPTLRDGKLTAVFAWTPRARILALASGVPHPSAPVPAQDMAHPSAPAQGTAPPTGPARNTAHATGPAQNTAPPTARTQNPAEQPYAPATPPNVLLQLCERLGREPEAVEGGPCFVFPPSPADAPAATVPDAAGVGVIVSDPPGRAAARRLARPGNWEPGEWDELTRGVLGEWAMAVHGGGPVSICFSPARNDRAAEAGIWTRPDFRGRRIAPAVVAAWAERERRTKQVLFYSTTTDNLASRSVARTLGLTPLGWIWTLR
ncbi:GNAT family N-acetyltransferase [Streptomyces silvensis]|uniref:N-acetyltransferase domain-containing protein n=1 Tax=Streptomyces silvensis TaxID=1765722 RepID=A0A0W7X610_9ACTN|nr:GNAT family N-acetyltransferase [Streptomyces silvensis]KUF18248.1 hypothetical protein AT728_25110 [Streptomyces silvensis]